MNQNARRETLQSWVQVLLSKEDSSQIEEFFSKGQFEEANVKRDSTGRFTAKASSGNGSASPTKKNFEKITKGMSVKQITSILGPPTEILDLSKKETAYGWNERRRKIDKKGTGI